MNKLKFTMFVCKLRTPSCANCEHFHVYLTYRNVVTRQTFDRAPRLTRPPTAHISKGDVYVYILISKLPNSMLELITAFNLVGHLAKHTDRHTYFSK